MLLFETKCDKLIRAFSEIFKFLLQEAYYDHKNLFVANYLEKFLDIIRNLYLIFLVI